MTHIMPLYATVGSNDPDRATTFYGDLLGSIGMVKIYDNPTGGALFGDPGTGMFAVLTPFDEKPATVGNGTMVGFNLPSREAVDIFYRKALSLGATDEGSPGERGGGFYACYIRDLDGNKLTAFHWVRKT